MFGKKSAVKCGLNVEIKTDASRKEWSTLSVRLKTLLQLFEVIECILLNISAPYPSVLFAMAVHICSLSIQSAYLLEPVYYTELLKLTVNLFSSWIR